MAAIIESKFRIFAAQKTIEGLLQTVLSQNNLYAFIGKTTFWPTDTSPPVPIDCTLNDNQVYFSMMHLKKINPTDCITVIPRYNWVANTIYAQYEDNVDLFQTVGSLPFFVITDEFNVYKCIFNNFGSPSFIKPIGTSTNIISGKDKYFWKYMFTVNDSNQLKYLTDAWVPCTTLLNNDGSQQWAVQQTAIPGTIEVIDILNGGSGYTSTPTITITGDGSGANAIPIINFGVITGIQILNRGINYTYATANVSGGGGSGASLKPIMSPPGGHGSDAAHELGATNVMFTVKFIQSEGGIFTVTNDYRQLGMILNPTLYNSTSLATGTDYTQTINLSLSNITGAYSPDDTITGSISGATATVLDFNATTGILRVVEVVGIFIPGEIIFNQLSTPIMGLLQISSGIAQSSSSTSITLNTSDSAATDAYLNDTIVISSGTGSGQQRIMTGNNSLTKVATINIPWNILPDSTSHYSIADIKYPDLQPNSGYVLYTENRMPITRSLGQTENLKMIVEF